MASSKRYSVDDCETFIEFCKDSKDKDIKILPSCGGSLKQLHKRFLQLRSALRLCEDISVPYGYHVELRAYAKDMEYVRFRFEENCLIVYQDGRKLC